MNKQRIQVFLGQPKGLGFDQLSQVTLRNGEEITVEQLRGKIKKSCFMVKLESLSNANPHGVLIPIGYDMPKFVPLDEFKDWAKKRPEDELAVVTESMLGDAETAEKAHCNVAFTSLCTYGFTNANFVNPETPVRSIGIDDEGNFFLRHQTQEYLVV